MEVIVNCLKLSRNQPNVCCYTSGPKKVIHFYQEFENNVPNTTVI